MYAWMFFIHLAGLAAWFGVTLMGVVMLSSVKGKLAEAGTTSVAISTIRNLNRITHPSALLVLISGVYMILQLERDGMPFWLTFMERGGGTITLLFIIILSIMGGKLKRKLMKEETAAAAKSIGTYVTTTIIFLLAVLAVLLVVSLKL